MDIRALESEKFQSVFPNAWQAYLREYWALIISCKADDLAQKLLTDDGFAQDFATLCFASDYAAKVIIQQESTWFLEQYQQGQLAQNALETNYAQSLQERLQGIESTSELMKQLRVFRRQTMVKIIWRHVLGLAQFEEEARALSNLADACIQNSLAYLYAQTVEQYGQPINDKGEPMSLIVIGMGKLGGQELNLSSDIDLIFTFEHEAALNDKYHHSDFFIALSKALIAVLHNVTEDGFVFRVDMRLRPHGDNGPLAMSLNAFERYYEVQGRAWERYAMIKARLISGRPEERAAFIRLIKPFIYRKYLDFSVLDAIREIKRSIHKELSGQAEENNIKLGFGGIREVEFIAQAYQIIHGGKKPELQTRNLLKTISALVTAEVLPAKDADLLEQGYRYLRFVEHRFQMLADKQTHSLPENPVTQTRIALAAGFENWDALLQVLSKHQRAVHDLFSKLIISENLSDRYSVAEVAILQKVQAIWLDTVSQEEALYELTSINFIEPEQTLALLRQYRKQFLLPNLSRKGQERLDKFMPELIYKVSRREEPELLIKRMLDILSVLQKKSAYVVMFNENPAMLDKVLDLCAYSNDFSLYIKQYPALLDDFLNETALYSLLERDTLQEQIAQAVADVAPEDIESQMNILRHIKHSQTLRVMASEIKNSLPLMKVSDKLTELAEEILSLALNIVWQQIQYKYPQAQAQAPNFVILAYGKLAGLEMNYRSDLDLVFIYEKRDDADPEMTEIYQRFAQRLMHFLSTKTVEGDLYTIDTRLRPTGESGLLVSTFTTFSQYQLSRAWVWEHQALVRSRVVAGDEALSIKIEQLRKQVLQQAREQATLKNEIITMRRKMSQNIHVRSGQFDLKHGFGGIVDIEFIVQYLVLAYAHQYPQLTAFPDNVRIIEQAIVCHCLTATEGEVLTEAYLSLRKYQHILALQNKSQQAPEKSLEPWIVPVRDLWLKIFDQKYFD